jgi:hypothetical protein
MTGPRDAVKRGEDGLPAAALRAERPLSSGGEAVDAAAAQPARSPSGRG